MLCYFRQVGPHLVYIHPIDRVDPGFGVPGYGHGGVDPGYGIEEGGRPDNELPGGPGWRPTDPGFGRPGLGRPVDPGYGRPIWHPGHPDHGLPSTPSQPGIPDNELPTTKPPTLPPNTVLVLVRTADGKWKYAAIQPGSPPPTVLPEPPPTAAPKS